MFSPYFSDNDFIAYHQGYDGFGSCHAGTCSSFKAALEPRRFGDYQYFMSFGGDQGSILQNSISAENFSYKFPSSYCGQIFTQMQHK
jgi:hypothetical protein